MIAGIWSLCVPSPKRTSFYHPLPPSPTTAAKFQQKHKRQVLVFGFVLLRRKTMKRQALGNQVGEKKPTLRSREMLDQRIKMLVMKVGLPGGAHHTRALVMTAWRWWGDAGSVRL